MMVEALTLGDGIAIAFRELTVEEKMQFAIVDGKTEIDEQFGPSWECAVFHIEDSQPKDKIYAFLIFGPMDSERRRETGRAAARLMELTLAPALGTPITVDLGGNTHGS